LEDSIGSNLNLTAAEKKPKFMLGKGELKAAL
jgi:hypothetical protein